MRASVRIQTGITSSGSGAWRVTCDRFVDSRFIDASSHADRVTDICETNAGWVPATGSNRSNERPRGRSPTHVGWVAGTPASELASSFRPESGTIRRVSVSSHGVPAIRPEWPPRTEMLDANPYQTPYEEFRRGGEFFSWERGLHPVEAAVCRSPIVCSREPRDGRRSCS